MGNGIFPTEITGQAANDLRDKGAEFGSNTKRPRRVGWLDIPALKYAIMLNGVTELVLTKADILNEMAEIPVCTHWEIDEQKISLAFSQSYEQKIKPIWKYLKGWNTDFCNIKQANLLPQTLRTFISFLEEELEVPIKYLSTGPQREELIKLAK
ncbi:MAG TPA: hypothetical protein DEF78_17150 [Sphingobacterium sp.]|nr:hypothetical protein [Sphingobacterium sp.]